MAGHLDIYRQFDPPFERFDNAMLGPGFADELATVSRLWFACGWRRASLINLSGAPSGPAACRDKWMRCGRLLLIRHPFSPAMPAVNARTGHEIIRGPAPVASASRPGSRMNMGSSISGLASRSWMPNRTAARLQTDPASPKR
jgi:hypothetical protein